MYEVLGKLPRHGVGSKIQRSSWYENSFWDIAEVKIDVSGKTGKAYGMLTWRGEQIHDRPMRIRGTLKKVWRAVSPVGDDARPVVWTSLDKNIMDSVSSASEKETSKEETS